jgi:hypothetical protein
VNDSIPEQLFYEGSASNAELLINLLLAFTLVYIPITIAVVGKRLWIKYRFTNKRVQIINSSPLFAKEVSLSLQQSRGSGLVPSLQPVKDSCRHKAPDTCLNAQKLHKW